MALEWKESPWLKVYRAAERRRRGSAWRRAARVSALLREPIDAFLVLAVIFAWAVLLSWLLPG